MKDAFDAERFRAEGHAVVDLLADHLRAARARQVPVLPWTEPDEQLERWPAGFPEEPSGDLRGFVARVVEHSTHLHSPKFVGHQVSAPLPSAALLELVSAFLNNGTGVYEMGPASNAMERRVVRFLAQAAGMPDVADGILTSGGSVGNLTALLTARQLRKRGVVVCSDQTHYSVARAAQILGLEAVAVASDERYRMRPESLEQVPGEILAVVASAGSTSTGAFDPLEPIADFCARRGAWLHVDGAHGASAVLSGKYRSALRGIGRADSLTWDAHKLMLMPALVTAVLYRDGAHSHATFSQEAHYLFSGKNWWDSGLRTLECTKRMMSVELYGALRIHGTRFFADYVTRMFDLARSFAKLLREEGFGLAVEPDCNIVCFRDPARDDAWHEEARRTLFRRGSFYLVQTKLRGKVFLRTTLIHPDTNEQDLVELVRELKAT